MTMDRGGFPTTTLSVVFGLRSEDAAERLLSLERLAAAYWKPVYKYLRLRWQKAPADAEEIGQEFFLRTVGKDIFNGYQADKARFRTYLRACLDNFVVDHVRHQGARKRGTGLLPISLDVETAEAELDGAVVEDPEKFFEKQWVRNLFEMSVRRLQATCIEKGKAGHFQVFERFHLMEDKASYADIGRELGLSAAEVTHRLQYARRELRAIVLLTLRELTTNEEEFREEARTVLGVDF